MRDGGRSRRAAAPDRRAATHNPAGAATVVNGRMPHLLGRLFARESAARAQSGPTLHWPERLFTQGNTAGGVCGSWSKAAAQPQHCDAGAGRAERSLCKTSVAPRRHPEGLALACNGHSRLLIWPKCSGPPRGNSMLDARSPPRQNAQKILECDLGGGLGRRMSGAPARQR